MSLQNKPSLIDPSEYEEKKRTPSNTSVRKEKERELSRHTQVGIIWHLLKRDKVFLLSVGNIVLVLNFVFPAWPQLLRSVL